MNVIFEIMIFIVENVWYTLPFFLVSIGLSVLVQMLKMEGFIKQAFANKIGVAIILATMVGAFSPLCSCTVIPVVAGLISSGVPLAPIMAFWIASPTMDPEILTLSIGILGFPLAITRLIATLVLSLGAGYLTWLVSKTGLLETAVSPKSAPASTAVPAFEIPLIQPEMALALEPIGGSGDIAISNVAVAERSCCTVEQDKDEETAVNWRTHVQENWQRIHWLEFAKEVAKESWRWGRWLLLAFLMEALIIRYVPQETIAQTLGNGNWFAVPLASLVGIPLYLTEISALPIVSGLMQQGMVSGAAIAFLIAGPVTTLPAMTAVYGTVNKRIFALYMFIGLGGAILFGFLTTLILG